MSTTISFFQITHHDGTTEIVPASKIIKIKTNNKLCEVQYYTQGDATTASSQNVTKSCKSVEPYIGVSKRSKSICVIS